MAFHLKPSAETGSETHLIMQGMLMTNTRQYLHYFSGSNHS
jgi:hypothetical protein